MDSDISTNSDWVVNSLTSNSRNKSFSYTDMKESYTTAHVLFWTKSFAKTSLAMKVPFYSKQFELNENTIIATFINSETPPSAIFSSYFKINTATILLPQGYLICWVPVLYILNY